MPFHFVRFSSPSECKSAITGFHVDVDMLHAGSLVLTGDVYSQDSRRQGLVYHSYVRLRFIRINLQTPYNIH